MLFENIQSMLSKHDLWLNFHNMRNKIFCFDESIPCQSTLKAVNGLMKSAFNTSRVKHNGILMSSILIQFSLIFDVYVFILKGCLLLH